MTIRHKLASLEQQGDTDFLLAVTHCPLAQWLEIEKSVWRIRTSTHRRRLFYDADSRLGIIKCMPSGPHERIGGIFELLIARIALSQFDYVLTCSELCVNSNHSRKEPDKSYTPTTRSPGEWPSLVVEVGYSQSMMNLRRDAKWWLESQPLVVNQGMIYRGVNQVILAKIERPQRRVLVESWILGPAPPITRNSGNRRGLSILHQPTMIFTATINNGVYTTTLQGPTTLPILWEALYDTPLPPGRGNFIIQGASIIRHLNIFWRYLG